jgi:hypothetical protein
MTSVTYITKKLKEYTERLKTGDVTKEEADEIYYDFLNDLRSVQKKSFARALCRWYKQVEKKLPDPGNYVMTVPLDIRGRYSVDTEIAMRACMKKLDLADAVCTVEVNKQDRIFAEKLKGITKVNRCYISLRAGEIRRALGDMFDDLVSVIEGYTAFAGSDGFGGRMEESPCEVVAERVYGELVSYIVYNSKVPAARISCSSEKYVGYIPCRVAVFSKDLHLFSFIPPAEETFRLALRAGIIDREAAGRFINGRTVRNFSVRKFVEQMADLLTAERRIEEEKLTEPEDGLWTDITR